MQYDPSFQHRMLTADASLVTRTDPARAAYFASRRPASSSTPANRFAERDRRDRERLARHIAAHAETNRVIARLPR